MRVRRSSLSPKLGRTPEKFCIVESLQHFFPNVRNMGRIFFLDAALYFHQVVSYVQARCVHKNSYSSDSWGIPRVLSSAWWCHKMRRRRVSAALLTTARRAKHILTVIWVVYCYCCKYALFTFSLQNGRSRQSLTQCVLNTVGEHPICCCRVLDRGHMRLMMPTSKGSYS